jgi:hypothetical protein
LGIPGLIVVACFLFVFFMFHHYGGRLGNDGMMNYIYVRSLVLDGDFDLTNEFEEFVPAKFQHIAEEARQLGKPPDPSNEPGPAFLWAPFFVLTHWIVLLLGRWGLDIPADGYSYPYINAVCVSGLLWGFIAVLIAYAVCRRYYPAHIAACSVTVLWLSSTFYWYTVMEPSMPHATAAAAVSLFLYLWLKVRGSGSIADWIVVALAGGLLLSMQRYSAFLLLAPALTLCGMVLRSFREGRFRVSRRLAWGLAGAGLAFLFTALPVLLYNLHYSREGSFLRMGDLTGFTLRHWNDPRIGEFLFSSNHGLFSWTPVAYLSVLGLFLLMKKDRRLSAVLLLTMVTGLYLLSSTWDWWAGYAFGSRRTTEFFLILALGFCGVVELFLRRPAILAIGAGLVLVGWNFLLAGQVKRGEVPMMGTFAFSDAAARGAERWYRLAGHPASLPASWLFASRYEVSPQQFDLTFGHRPYHNLTVDVGGDQDRFFLGKGWSFPETLPNGESYRWSTEAESSWLIPLFGPFHYNLSLEVEPSRHREGRGQTVSIVVNDRRAGTLRLTEGWQTVAMDVPESFWNEGINEVKFRYAWVVEAGEIYGGEDPRRIALRLSRFGLRIVK